MNKFYAANMDRLTPGCLFHGFTLYARGKQNFFITAKTRKTDKLIVSILSALGIKDADKDKELIDLVKRGTYPAEMHVDYLMGKKDFDISGRGFGGYGGSAEFVRVYIDETRLAQLVNAELYLKKEVLTC